MHTPHDHNVTALLDRIRAGDEAATGELLSLAYAELRALLTDHARAKRADQRGGGRLRVSLDGGSIAGPSASQIAGSPAGVDLVELDETITKLSAMDPSLGQIFNLRFLVGLSVEVTAEVAEVSPRKVELDTRFIRAWLQKELVK